MHFIPTTLLSTLALIGVIQAAPAADPGNTEILLTFDLPGGRRPISHKQQAFHQVATTPPPPATPDFYVGSGGGNRNERTILSTDFRYDSCSPDVKVTIPVNPDDGSVCGQSFDWAGQTGLSFDCSGNSYFPAVFQGGKIWGQCGPAPLILVPCAGSLLGLDMTCRFSSN